MPSKARISVGPNLFLMLLLPHSTYKGKKERFFLLCYKEFERKRERERERERERVREERERRQRERDKTDKERVRDKESERDKETKAWHSS